MDFFFQTLLFDAIIGNTDRHQENWAFLGKVSFITNILSHVEQEAKLKGFENDAKEMHLKLTNLVGMAPIYDNGSSLGRELTDQKVKELLTNEKDLKKYVENGKAEVHWQHKKLTHFKLIENLLNSPYLEQIILSSSFLTLWDETKVNEIIKFIDKDIPDAWHSYCIPQSRKDLMLKLLILRFEKLRGLINDRI